MFCFDYDYVLSSDLFNKNDKIITYKEMWMNLMHAEIISSLFYFSVLQ